MTHLLRLVLSAASGAVLVTGLFAAMGKATAPRIDDADLTLLANRAGAENAQMQKVSGDPFVPTPAVPNALIWDDYVVHPGFDTETHIDTASLEPELVVLSKPLSTTEAEHERRWWQNLARQLGEDE